MDSNPRYGSPVTDPVSSERALKRQQQPVFSIKEAFVSGLTAIAVASACSVSKSVKAAAMAMNGQFAHVSPLVLKICGRA